MLDLAAPRPAADALVPLARAKVGDDGARVLDQVVKLLVPLVEQRLDHRLEDGVPHERREPRPREAEPARAARAEILGEHGRAGAKGVLSAHGRAQSTRCIAVDAHRHAPHRRAAREHALVRAFRSRVCAARALADARGRPTSSLRPSTGTSARRCPPAGAPSLTTHRRSRGTPPRQVRPSPRPAPAQRVDGASTRGRRRRSACGATWMFRVRFDAHVERRPRRAHRALVRATACSRSTAWGLPSDNDGLHLSARAGREDSSTPTFPTRSASTRSSSPRAGGAALLLGACRCVVLKPERAVLGAGNGSVGVRHWTPPPTPAGRRVAALRRVTSTSRRHRARPRTPRIVANVCRRRRSRASSVNR